MKSPLAFACAFAFASAPHLALAQHGGPPVNTVAPHEATQYNFLIGQWDLTITPKVSGLVAAIHGQPRMHGSWRAWRAFDGWGIEDEIRIVDESGNPTAFTHFDRVYDATAKHWSVVSIDAYHQAVTQSISQMIGAEMTSTATGKDSDGDAFITRARYTLVTPNSFRWQQDRSTDGGKTWDLARLVIDAKRAVAPATR